jgi:hypothetical protein
MSDSSGLGLLDRAREAASRGAWPAAYDLLVEAESGGLLGADHLPFLAEAAYASGHLDATIEAWERAYVVPKPLGSPS